MKGSISQKETHSLSRVFFLRTRIEYIVEKRATMKDWNEYFSSVNEHHKETREEQASWICEIIEKLTDEQVKEVYEMIEEKLGISER